MPLPVSLFEFVGACGGIGVVMVSNFAQKKPMNTGIYKHAAGAIVGFFAGRKLENLDKERYREKLLVIEDYVSRHPEDFPEEARRTYGDVLLKWYPVR